MKQLKEWWTKKQKLHFVMHAAKRYLHKELAQDLFHALLHSIDASKTTQTPRGQAASDLPICLVLGATKSGKSAFLSASQMVLTESTLLNHAYQPMKGLGLPHHYLTPHCLFVEVPQYFLVNESAKQIPYLEQLLLCWKKFGYVDRIQQIVITISAQALFDHQQKTEKISEEFWHSLQLFLSHLTGSSVTLAVVVTQMDQLQGFTEFFTDLSIEERQHSFGFALKSQGDFSELLQKQMAHLLQRLQRRMLWRCQAEHMLSRRMLIAEFPKQFEALTKSLTSYLQPLLHFLPNLPRVKFKACFFTSALQRGEPQDWLILGHDYAQHLEKPSNMLPMIPKERVYFSRGVFQFLRGNKPLAMAAPNVTAPSMPRWKKICWAIVWSVVFLWAIFFGLVWVHVEHVIEKHPNIAYNILASDVVVNNLQNFVDYEMPYLPSALQYEIAKSSHLRAVVNDSARQYVQDRWNESVFQAYQKSLADRYPLVKEAKSDASWSVFNAMYAPNGLLMQFQKRYLTQPKIQVLFTSSHHVDKLYQALSKFSHVFYDTAQANMTLTIYPDRFAPNVTKVILLLQGNKIVLKPHAIIAANFVWPEQALSPQSGLIIEYNNGPARVKMFTGDWSWMRVLTMLHWQVDENNYRVMDPSGAFSMQVSSNISLLSFFDSFSELKLPQKL